jgi:predicted aspartyl protease
MTLEKSMLLQWVCTALLILLAAGPASGAFYEYTDRDGRRVFVDDPDNIPLEYRPDARTYTEPTDGLSETERLEHESRELEKQRRVKDNYIDHLKEIQRKSRNNARSLQESRKAGIEPSETPVTIANNKIILPVTLAHQGVQVETRLLLDTGASALTLHREVVEELKIQSLRPAKVRVVGGNTIPAGVVTLSYVTVGPVTVDRPIASVITHTGTPVPYSGLLGMNILKAANFRIDFERKVIQWLPEPENQ